MLNPSIVNIRAALQPLSCIPSLNAKGFLFLFFFKLLHVCPVEVTCVPSGGDGGDVYAPAQVGKSQRNSGADPPLPQNTSLPEPSLWHSRASGLVVRERFWIHLRSGINDVQEKPLVKVR